MLQVGNEIKLLKVELKKKKSLLQMDELKCRKRVLRRLGYCTASDVIEMKGRVACEISRYLVTETKITQPYPTFNKSAADDFENIPEKHWKVKEMKEQ